MRNPVRYVYILPNDYVGEILVIYHPDGPDEITDSGRTITLNVPPSGLVVTADRKSLHRLCDDAEWRYQDGRVIKRFPNRLADGFSFVGSRGAGGRGIRRDDPLFEWAVWDSESNYYKISFMKYEVVRGARPEGATSL